MITMVMAVVAVAVMVVAVVVMVVVVAVVVIMLPMMMTTAITCIFSYELRYFLYTQSWLSISSIFSYVNRYSYRFLQRTGDS